MKKYMIAAVMIFTALIVSAQEANMDRMVNPTFSPDSSKVAYTLGNDLYVKDMKSGAVTRLTSDGSQTILNGYASWVYYEEILGRPSRYKAFWWSPDSKKIAFYRFDNSLVPVFPIFSAKGQDGKLNNTRYPKAGEHNPEVMIGFVSAEGGDVTWADFDPKDDQYFGTPFWGDDSKALFVSREPRIQNTLDVYRVDASTGSKKAIYHETSDTWLDWITGMLFTDKGLYMARCFETGWQQIYFLSYEGELRRLTDGTNWNISLEAVDPVKGNVYFIANRDSDVRKAFYCVDKKGRVKALTDPSLNVDFVSMSPDFKTFECVVSNYSTPYKSIKVETAHPEKVTVVHESKNDSFDKGMIPHLVYIENDGFRLPGCIVYPKDFDPSKKYPVHVDIYGGPDTPQVSDSWCGDRYKWYYDNGIIEVVADCRAAGHNGRAGLDMIYCHLNSVEVEDFIAWGKYLQSLPYVKADKIGVEGFSFGGTMTTTLLCKASEYYHYGIAGGGVYDWALYDTHYTERFMETPQTNPDGYASSKVLGYVKDYPVEYSDENAGKIEPVMLKITHGTGDDNVHFQNTLQLIDALQQAGKKFEFMIYPDGMHGYRGAQGRHFQAANHEFWLKYLKEEK